MEKRNERIRRLCVMAMLCAMAYAAVALIRIPVVSFLKYEPKDVLLVIGGFMYGPIAGAVMSIVVGLLEMVTVSDTGLIGMAMNVLSSCLFVCIASAVYQKKRSISGAVGGLVIAILATTAGMLLWNFLVTPLYMGISREAVSAMLLPVFLPFNLFKGTLNAALTLLLYKPVVSALRKTHLMPPSTSAQSRRNSVWLVALFVVLTLVAVWLLWTGKI